MKQVIALFALLLSSVVLGESVVTLTDDTIQPTLDGNQFVLVEFYAPWCGHCKSLAPEYEKAAEQLKADPSTEKVILAKVDATAEKNSASQFKIEGFPTLKWFVNGKASDFGGGRTADSIVNWIKKKTGPATTKLTTVAEVEKFKTSGEVVVILAADEESKSFEEAANALEVPFGVALNPSAEILTALELKSSGFIVLYKSFDEKRAQMAVTDSTPISTFVEGHLLPLIVPFSQETAQKIFGGNVKQHFLLFVDKTNTEQMTAVKGEAQPVAEKYRGTYLFVTIDKSDSRVLEFFGLGEKDLPTARLVEMNDSGMKKYKLVGDKITSASLSETIEKHIAKGLTPDLKSEDIPAKNDEDIKVLVGKNFDAIVKQPGKDVFVEFYAPWCGHCKSLAPKFEELAKWAKTKPNLIIAKMDSTLNEVAEVSVSGFPTLKLFKADSNEIIDYNEPRELEDMKKFLEKNAASCAA